MKTIHSSTDIRAVTKNKVVYELRTLLGFIKSWHEIQNIAVSKPSLVIETTRPEYDKVFVNGIEFVPMEKELQKARQEERERISNIIKSNNTKGMWWCWGENISTNENILEISHITKYPCKEHPHSSGGNVDVGYNKALDDILKAIDL